MCIKTQGMNGLWETESSLDGRVANSETMVVQDEADSERRKRETVVTSEFYQRV